MRPRVICPACNRSIATTGDATGARWTRTHKVDGRRCPGSRRDARNWPDGDRPRGA